MLKKTHTAQWQTSIRGHKGNKMKRRAKVQRKGGMGKGHRQGDKQRKPQSLRYIYMNTHTCIYTHKVRRHGGFTTKQSITGAATEGKADIPYG